MAALLGVVLPVFLIIGAGYLATWRGLFQAAYVDGLMAFTQKFAIPCLLFMAIATLDLGTEFDPALLLSFYTGSLAAFAAGMMGARLIFNRPWPDAVAIGFSCFFANSVLLGLPITEQAYGTAALAPNFAIVSVNAAFCYGIGITVMEVVRAETGSPLTLMNKVGRGMFSNALMLGILSGFLVNLTGLPVPGVVEEALELMIRGAIPAALFGLGGVLYRYRPEGDMTTIAYICAVSLILHPAIVFGMGKLVTDLTPGQLRSAVVTAAMAPGVNSYLFADMYGVARRVAATSVLIGTALSVITAAIWLNILG